MVGVIKFTKGRFSERPRPQTIETKFRELFTVAARKIERMPSMRWIEHRLYPVMKEAEQKYGLNEVNPPKIYLNKWDLGFMIEEELESTKFIETAENFHLSWLLGLICEVRPGSIGWSQYKDDKFLRWKDIKIYR